MIVDDAPLGDPGSPDVPLSRRAVVALLRTPRVVLTAVWGAAIITAVIALTVFELYGFMGLFGIKLNGVPVISLIMCVGVGVEFTAHITLAFIMAPPPTPAAASTNGGADTTFARAWWCCGCRHIHANDARVAEAMALMFAATFHGSVSTFLGILMLAFSAFEFIVKYFFLLFFLITVLGALNGLFVLPILLTVFGPPSLGGEHLPTINDTVAATTCCKRRKESLGDPQPELLANPDIGRSIEMAPVASAARATV